MQNSAPPQKNIHVPVLCDDVLGLLDPKIGESYLDLTAGYGGHAAKIVKQTRRPDLSVLVDRDKFAFEYLKSLAQFKESTIVHSSFNDFAVQLKQDDKKFDMILLDLGVSSPQLDIATRGFSFTNDGPLDMRMDTTLELSAKQVVNEYPASDLTEVLRKYGDLSEQFSKIIVDAIVAARPINSTSQLAQVVKKFENQRHKKTVSLVFQAIRIEVNDEIEQLGSALPTIVDLLQPSGRLAVISFHSLEDRIVKKFFKDREGAKYEEHGLALLTKNAIQGKINDATNPRSRSAKLRACVLK